MRKPFIWSFLHKARENTAYPQLKPQAPCVPWCSPWDVHRPMLPFAPSEDPARSEKACFCWIFNTLSPTLVYSCYSPAHLWDTSELAQQAQNISSVSPVRLSEDQVRISGLPEVYTYTPPPIYDLVSAQVVQALKPFL